MGSAVDRTFSSGEGIDKLKERLKAKPAAITGSTTKLDSRERSPHREAVAGDEKILSREEEVKLEEEGCEKETSSLEKMAHLEAVREGLARVRDDPALEEVAAAVAPTKVAASARDPHHENRAAKSASTNPTYAEKLARREAVREGLARGKIAFLLEEERIRLEAKGKAEEDATPEAVVDATHSDQNNPALSPAETASTKIDYNEMKARREAVREGLARAKIDFLRDEEGRRLEEERKAEKEYKKKKREEENKMRDDKRKQKMDKNTKPKGKGKK